MDGNVVAKHLLRDPPLLEALVGSFLMGAHAVLHGFVFLGVCEALGALDLQWSFSPM